MRLFLALTSFLVSSYLMAAPLNFELKNSKDTAQKNEISFSYEWMNTNQLDASYRKFLGIRNNSEVREVLITSYNFYLLKSIKSFHKGYFENIRLLEQLSGMKYEKTNRPNNHKINFKPHPLKTITAVSNLRTLMSSVEIEDLFSLERANEKILIHQTVENFSDYLDRTDIITEIKKENTGSRFTINSIAILNTSESHSSMLAITKKAMISKLKDQMKQTPDIFFNN